MEFLIALVIGAVAGGAVVYIYHAKIKKEVENRLPGDPPLSK